jgi:hypothetical protein
MPARRPKVFISSTVYDFRDLRSALKYWLEELGYEVLLSEHNDFPAQVDLNSYESCLRAIDDSDYFIVLVGSRVGGWYNEASRISITQAEYRRAYELLVAGKVKLLAFVRQDVWDIREDRKELERLLKSEALHHAELEEKDIRTIAKHPSKFLNDADFTFSFLTEIARLEEMKVAVADKGPFPPGNWIRQFSGFRDIIDALRVEFRCGVNLRRVALLANLRAEIESNLRQLLTKTGENGDLTPRSRYAVFARDALKGGVDDKSQIKAKHLRWLGMFALFGCGLGRKLSTNALDEAITSGEMLDFDQESGAFVVGPLQNAMLYLKRNIDRLRHNDELMDDNSRVAMATQFSKLDGDTSHSVTNIDLVPILAIHDSFSNVAVLSRSIYQTVSGNASAVDGLTLYDDSPLSSEAQKMKNERPTPEQTEQWLRKMEKE